MAFDAEKNNQSIIKIQKNFKKYFRLGNIVQQCE